MCTHALSMLYAPIRSPTTPVQVSPLSSIKTALGKVLQCLRLTRFNGTLLFTLYLTSQQLWHAASSSLKHSPLWCLWNHSLLVSLLFVWSSSSISFVSSPLPPLHFVCLFIFGCIGSSLAVHGLSLVVVSGGYYSLQCAGFSLWWLLLLQSMGSRRGLQ